MSEAKYCKERVPDGWRGRQCARTPAPGSAYCVQHNPERVEARREARSKAWDAKWAQEKATAKAGEALLSDLGIDGCASTDGTLRITQDAARQLLARIARLEDGDRVAR